MAKALPLKLWLELEDDVARHRAEIAQAFAEARARLLPEPGPNCMTLDELLCERARRQMDMLTNAYGKGFCDPRTGAVIWNAGYNDPCRGGLFGLGFLGM